MNPHKLYSRLRPVLSPLGLPYALLMKRRRALFERGTAKQYTAACPCVSVGNIAWGGTGKTPLTAWLLSWAESKGLRAVVLTRGYGGNPGKRPLLVRPDTPPRQSGDEPLMLATAFPAAHILAFPKRAESARLAEATLAPDLFILDDGMQHLAVARDVNLVLLRPEDLDEEWNRVIPSGSWREGASALASASCFLLKADEAAFERLAPLAAERLRGFGRPVFGFSPCPVGLQPLHAPGEEQSADAALAGSPYILVSGVGNPASVEEAAFLLTGRPPLRHFAYADHHPYSAGDVQAIMKLSAAPLPVVCTAKDAVKLRAFADLWANTPVWVLEMKLRFGGVLFSETGFPEWWEQRWRTMREGGPGALSGKGAPV